VHNSVPNPLEIASRFAKERLKAKASSTLARSFVSFDLLVSDPSCPLLLVRITDLKKAPKKSLNLLENGSQETTYYNVASSLSLSLSLSVSSPGCLLLWSPDWKQKHPTAQRL
jgi:hypothetical protein